MVERCDAVDGRSRQGLEADCCRCCQLSAIFLLVLVVVLLFVVVSSAALSEPIGWTHKNSRLVMLHMLAGIGPLSSLPIRYLHVTKKLVSPPVLRRTLECPLWRGGLHA